MNIQWNVLGYLRENKRFLCFVLDLFANERNFFLFMFYTTLNVAFMVLESGASCQTRMFCRLSHPIGSAYVGFEGSLTSFDLR